MSALAQVIGPDEVLSGDVVAHLDTQLASARRIAQLMEEKAKEGNQS